MAEYTLAHSDKAKGWVSFYSYIPNWMMGMNQYFYTWKGGNLFRHNSNVTRNNFYGVQYNSEVQTVFNSGALENKLFKTIALQGDDGWSAIATTDIQTSGFIEPAWFEKKESVWFAFLRNDGTQADNLPLRSYNGIGRSATVLTSGVTQTITFSISPLVKIGNIISIGDNILYSVPPFTEVALAGTVEFISVNYQQGINLIQINTTGGTLIPIQNAHISYMKSSVAESYGVVGHYAVVTLENEETDRTELFAVETEIMKSYP